MGAMSVLNDPVGVRFDPSTGKGHVESYFLKANDPSGSRALWLKATIFASSHDPRRAVAEAWAIAFDRDAGHVAVKQMVPFDRARFARQGLEILFDGLRFEPGHTEGEVSTAGRTIGWNLRFPSETEPLVHYPHGWMYDGPFPSSKLVSPYPDLRLSGDVRVGEARWELREWPGMLGHNWGRRHAHAYAWGHCNLWDEAHGTGIVFEGLSGRIAVGPVVTPTLTLLCVRHRGVPHYLNAVMDLVRNKGEFTTRRWKFSGESPEVRLEGEMWGETEDFVGLYYENPDRRKTHCLNSKLASARLSMALMGGPALVLHSRTAALEIGTQSASHGVRMYV
jgi:hypothetical protein